MNTEKEITFSELRGKFSKDFDTFGKMDPFVEFTVGKCVARTETADGTSTVMLGGGKEPQWKNSIVLTYFDETYINLRSYDEDATENEYMGAGKIEVKGLRFPGGNLEVSVFTDSGENIGTVTGKYTIRNLNPTPLLLIKNIKCTFVKELTLITKSKPCFQVASDEGQSTTQTKDEVQNLSVNWTQTLRLRVKEGSKLTLSLLDKNSNDTPVFRYECNAREFRLQAGSRRFNVFGADFLYLGVLQLDFQSVNLVSKEESVKNAEKEKKSESELTSITVEKVKTELKSGNKDIYYHFVVGTNKIETQVVKNCPAVSTQDVKKILYADSRQNKLTAIIWESNLLRDKALASASVRLEEIAAGDKKITLYDTDGKDAGSITLSLGVKQVPAKIINLQSMSIQLLQTSDLIGESEPYIVAKIGGASNRTQTGDKNTYSFKRGIQLKYFDEDLLEFQLWDEDVTNDEKISAEKIKLSDLKGNKGEYTIKFLKEGTNSTIGKFNFKYDIKNNAPSEPPKKLAEKKTVDPPQPPPAPKVQVPPPQPKVEVPPPPPKIEQKPIQKPIQPPKKQEVIPEPPRKQQIKQEQAAQSKTLQASARRKTEEAPFDDSRAQRSLNKSIHRDSILPSISSNQHNYGDRIYDKQSAATLQKSIVAYSMPKANRFRDEPKYTGEPTYCLDSCFKSSSMKGVGFGFGRKKQFPDWVQRNMKEIPPPGAYFDGKADIRAKGPTFGISHKYYEKVLIPKEKPLSNQPRNQTNRKLSPIRERK